MEPAQDKILRPIIVNLARNYGGAEVRALQLAQAFNSEGCRLVCLKDSPLSSKAREAGLQPVEVGASKLNPGLALSLRNICIQDGNNIIDAHNVQSYFWTYAATRGLSNRPALVATVHSSTRLEQASQLKGSFFETITRLVVPLFDHTITVSRFICSELMTYNIPAGRISRVPNGVQFERAGSQQGSAIRKELGIQPEDLVIGAVGRLEPAKGIDILIPAVVQLIPKWPQIKLLVVGDGRMAESLKDLAKYHDLEKKVIFTGFRSDIPSLLEAIDIFTLPSRTEGIPIALLEACYCALPIVASRVGGVPEVITHGQTGILVDRGDITALAKGIDILLSNPSYAVNMGQQACTDVIRRYSLEAMQQGTRKAYHAALEYQKAGRLWTS